VRLEGGFQGRTNKLVDSCYSFWQGAALAIVVSSRIGTCLIALPVGFIPMMLFGLHCFLLVYSRDRLYFANSGRA